MTGRRTLSFDVGGSHVKAALLGRDGRLAAPQDKLDTPRPLTPRTLLELFGQVAARVGRFDRVAVGIPGLVHHDVVYSLPAANNHTFKRVPLGDSLRRRFHVPARVTNDAVMHGLAAIRGEGVEMVITLGTGLGTALFIDRVLSAHYQTLAPDDAPFGSAYGDAALKRIGRARWERRLHKLIAELRAATGFDHLYIGGGNARRINGRLPRNVSRIDNVAGVLGGHRLWEWGEVP
jgi:polyphosphate glucokinase